MRGSRSVQASAIAASVWPRRCGDRAERRATLASGLLGQLAASERQVPVDPRALGDAVEVAVGQQPLGERREADAADAELAEDVEQAVLDPAVEHRVRRLVDQQRRAEPVAGSRRPRACAPAEYDEIPT